MNTGFCSAREVLHPSTLLDFSYEIGPYYGCEHNCHYCYAHNNAETDWTREVLVHEGFAGLLARELDVLGPQTIFIGRETDPYQPIEQELRHTRQALELLSERNFSACILTKSDMMTRDIDVIKSMPGSSVGISFAFHDETTRRLFEEKAPTNRARIEVLAKMREAGIETYALISPVFPLITDVEKLITELIPCADTIWIYRLDIDSEAATCWKNITMILQTHFPDILHAFGDIVFDANHSYWRGLKRTLNEIKQNGDVTMKICL